METRTVEQVESWSSRSFSDGYAGLRKLSDGEFSGAVRANGAWLFMLNGRIIGVYEGSLDDFENASGTAYSAPHPSLPLLFSMQAKGGETQAKYYTNDKPLSEVDSTLSEGKFTGYIELSENVLSGDYYVAYYGGRSMSVAFVGASEQVVSGDEAYERAADEVGIYEVHDVDLEIIDVPEPENAGEPDATSDAAGGEAARQSDESAAGQSATGQSTAEQSATGQSATAGQTGASDGQATSERPGHDAGAAGDSQTTDQSASEGRPASERGTTDAERGTKTAEKTATADAGVESTPASDADASTAEAATTGTESGATTETDASATDAAATTTDTATTETAATGAETTTEASTTAPDASTTRSESATEDETTGSDDAETGDDAFSAEAEWRETTTIPSLDPEQSPDARESDQSETSQATDTKVHTETDSPASERTTDNSASSPTSEQDASGSSAPQSGGSATGTPTNSASGTTQSGDSAAGASERIQTLQSQLEQRKQQVQRLKDRLSTVEAERNEYERERDALRQEVERLEAKLETTGSSGAGGRQLDRTQAFDGTNLFVRYESKGKATLEEAAEGEATRADVNENLRLEYHTQFEAENVTVDGEAFDAFLTNSFEYRFVSWVVEELLYEIRKTGHETGLKGVYEAIPRIDRVDLHGSVDAGGDEDETRTESFDVIMRDRMGNPLLVADLNDSRDPTTGGMMDGLVDASTGVAEAYDELAGSFQVTASFFEPPALETAETETNGGLLNRGKRESFVKLSRKRGYHLCLVESRSGGFHLTVPEL